MDGARAFGKTFQTNSTLEFVDFGHNSIRDEGIYIIYKFYIFQNFFFNEVLTLQKNYC